MQHDVMGAIVVVARFNMYFERDISHLLYFLFAGELMRSLENLLPQ
jgi:hypothetical protein